MMMMMRRRAGEDDEGEEGDGMCRNKNKNPQHNVGNYPSKRPQTV